MTPPGATQVLAVGVDSGSMLYAATELGIFRSLDGGETWIAPNAPIEASKGVYAFTFDPAVPSIAYGASAFSGVLKSDNRGESWGILNSIGDEPRVVTALTVDPSSPTTLYAGSYLGVLFKSTDGGTTWQRRSLEFPYAATIRSIAVDPVSPATVYVGTDHFAFKSTNGGLDWQMLGVDRYVPTGQPINVMAIALDPRSPRAIYAATGCTVGFEGPPCGDGVYRSEDGGTAWTALHGGMGPYTPVWSLAFLPGTGILYAGTYYGVFQLPAGGRSWLPVNEGLQELDVHALAYAEDSDSLYAATDRLFKLPGASQQASDRAPRHLLFR